jgi:hypothetical protein
MRHVLLGLSLAAAGLALRGHTSILVVLGFGLVGWGVAQQAAEARDRR